MRLRCYTKPATMKDEFISTEHLFIALFSVANPAREALMKFHIDKENVLRVLAELREGGVTESGDGPVERSVPMAA